MSATIAQPLKGGEYKTIEWKDAWTSLDGISEQTMRNHWKLYEGYVGKWKEIETKLASVDWAAANQIYSDVRALKTDLTFAIGGVKNHQIYFDVMGGDGSQPTGWLWDAIEKQWGSWDAFKAELKATGLAGRGWAWLAYDWDTGQFGIYLGDTQNTFPIWNATPIFALDVYEHAYFADFGTDRASYIDTYMRNVDWSIAAAYGEAAEIDKALAR